MTQLFLLSVLANIVAGLTLTGDYLGEKMKFLASFKILRENRSETIAVGLTALCVGVVTIFVRAPGDSVPIVGDLLPSLAGIAMGLGLLAEVFRKNVEKRGANAKKISKAVLTFRAPAGIVCVAIGVVHFLFPAAVLL